MAIFENEKEKLDTLSSAIDESIAITTSLLHSAYEVLELANTLPDSQATVIVDKTMESSKYIELFAGITKTLAETYDMLSINYGLLNYDTKEVDNS